jgi:hypothetical protein
MSQQDVHPDTILHDAGRILEIEQDGDKSHIIANRTAQNEFESKQDLKISGGGSFLGISAFANFAENNQERWKNASTSLDNQLRELNRHSKGEIEWTVDGNRVVPKSLNLSMVSRASLRKSIRFSHVKTLVGLLTGEEMSLLLSTLTVDQV